LKTTLIKEVKNDVMKDLDVVTWKVGKRNWMFHNM
jgi:hypothetical protein